MAQLFSKPVLAGAIALATLAGCAMDEESQVRAQVDEWVDIGKTLYFDSQMTCTAGVFALVSDQVKSAAPHAVTIREGLTLIRQRGVAKFQDPGLSPSDISAQINSQDIAIGNGVLSSGLDARECLTEAWRADFVAALQARGAVLIYRRAGNALAIIDQTNRQVFFARGDV
ncbi:hypothetical protein ACSSNL_02155 [Thalassobius sp. S69A]|uniref:hypothetical protein n=1 Tax=unclassified Thalassovita TaxID=2619711 RepID=UPI003C7BE66C